MMLRPRNFGWLVMIIGICLVWFGILEYRVSSGASSEAIDVELANLESGNPLPGNHINIGVHHCLYPASVIEYQAEADSTRPTSSSKIVWLYSPIISNSHPYMEGLRELEKTHGSLTDVPNGTAWPKLGDVTVLVKSEAYETVADIPRQRKYYESIDGLVINKIEPLGNEEKSLIRASFPDIDFDKILILEHGRKPTSKAGALAWIVAGSLCVLIPVFVGFRAARVGPIQKPAAASAVSEWKVADIPSDATLNRN